MRPQPVRKTRSLRVGRAALVAATVGLIVVGVSSAAGGGLSFGLIHNSGPAQPAACDQYSPQPHIASIFPLQGTIGTTVTINGTGLATVAEVAINGAIVSDFTVVSDTEITAVVPDSNETATGHVFVSTDCANHDTSTDTFSYAPAPPGNTAAPHITGTQNLGGVALALVGNALTVSTGTWTGSPTSFSYQWEDCDSTYGNCTDIGLATADDTYTLASSDVGHTVIVAVIASNAAGNTIAYPVHGDLTGNVGAPNPTANDAGIGGSLTTGSTLTASHGTWDGDGGVGAITFHYQWYRCGTSAPSDSSGCTPISGATNQTYTPLAADQGKYLGVVVSGSNTTGGSNGLTLFAPTSSTIAVGFSVGSFSPLNGAAGTVVQIQGDHFMSGGNPDVTGVKFNGVNAASFTVVSNTMVTAVVGSGSSSGQISVSTSLGTATSTDSFTVVSVPSVTSFSPTSGGVGSSVTITGTNFTGATAVKFNATSTSTFSVNGAGTQITVNVPTGSTTGKISVITSAGTGISTDTYTVLALPTVSSFLPAAGAPNASTTTVTINGSNFVNVTSVKIAGTDATFATTPGVTNKLTASIPAIPLAFSSDGALVGKVFVTTAAGTGTSTGNFTIYAQPSIGSYTPTRQQPGGKVTLFGTGFLGTPTGGVKLDTTVIPFIVNSDTQITATLPTTEAIGTHTWHVTNPAGTGDGDSGGMTVAALAIPDPFTFSPSEGPAATTVTLTCTNPCNNPFYGVTSVTFNHVAATIVSVSGDAKTLVTSVPATATSGLITVTNAKGLRNSATNFVVDPQPKINTINPTSGLAGSGTSGTNVTITGFNLIQTGKTTTITFNGSSTPTTITAPGVGETATSISAHVPSDATTGPITVAVSGVGSVNTASFTVVQQPTITSISPLVGTTGTVVTVNGTNFVGTMTARFVFGVTSVNGASVKVLSSTQLTVNAPAHPLGLTSANIIVHNAFGDSTASTDSFTYPGAPAGIQFSPIHGPANTQQTTSVTITGTGFTGVTSVLFGTKPAAGVIANSDTSITAFAPAGAVTGAISVVTPAGTGKSAAFSGDPTGVFTVDPLPTIVKFTPTPPLGAAPGTAVVISGTNFILTTGSQIDGVSVNGTALTAGNGTDAGTFHVVNATTINATLPSSGVSSGPITVTNSAVGSATSAASLIVKATPTIASFTPESGIVNTKVTITGTNFAGGGLTVTFNGDDVQTGNGPKNGTAVTVLSNTQATVMVPAGATSGTITVSNSAGSSDPSSDEFYVAIHPVITNFDPISGPASSQASTVVYITGQHLFGVTGVLFGTKASPYVSIDDDGDITALVPAGATTGKITLTSPAGPALSGAFSGDPTGVFTADAPPSVTSIATTQGAVGDTVTINGKGFIGERDGDTCGCDAEGTTVDFHGAFTADVTSITSTQIQVTVPTGAVTGPLVVTNVWGEQAVSPVYTVVQPPAITDFDNEFTGLRSGKAGQGVLINGSGFTGTSSVAFNGTNAPKFSVVDDGDLLVIIPKNATTGPITVTNEADTATTAPNNFTILP